MYHLYVSRNMQSTKRAGVLCFFYAVKELTVNNSNSYDFIKLCYGVVGSYKDTSKMTTRQVIEEFLRHEGVSSAEEYFDKTKNNTYLSANSNFQNWTSL